MFNWRIIALQCCVGFCHQIRSDQSLGRVRLFATAWISHKHTYASLHSPNFPSIFKVSFFFFLVLPSFNILWKRAQQNTSVQSLIRVWLFATPCTVAHQASLSIISSQSLPKLTSIKLVTPSSHLILCHPLLLLPPILPSIRVFSNESTLCMRWPKYWSFSFSISPSNEHPGLISFRMDWLDLLAVQGTLMSVLQHTKYLKKA